MRFPACLDPGHHNLIKMYVNRRLISSTSDNSADCCAVLTCIDKQQESGDARFSNASAQNQQVCQVVRLTRSLNLICRCSVASVFLIGRSVKQISRRLKVHPKPDPPLPSTCLSHLEDGVDKLKLQSAKSKLSPKCNLRTACAFMQIYL